MLYARLYAGTLMNQFVLNLFDATHEQRITGVTSFIGEDSSGCFGVQPNHAWFMTIWFWIGAFSLGTATGNIWLFPCAVVYFNKMN